MYWSKLAKRGQGGVDVASRKNEHCSTAFVLLLCKSDREKFKAEFKRKSRDMKEVYDAGKQQGL